MALKPKHKEFADKFIDTNNATQAVQEVFGLEDPNHAGVKGYRLLRNAKVREYLEDKAEIAASVVFEIATAGDNDNVRLSASKDILDRAGFNKIDKSVILTTDVDSTERTRDLGTRLVGLFRRGN